MSLWTCRGCTARYAVDAPACPQCGGTKHDDTDTISPAAGVTGDRCPEDSAAAAAARPAAADTTRGGGAK